MSPPFKVKLESLKADSLLPIEVFFVSSVDESNLPLSRVPLSKWEKISDTGETLSGLFCPWFNPKYPTDGSVSSFQSKLSPNGKP